MNITQETNDYFITAEPEVVDLNLANIPKGFTVEEFLELYRESGHPFTIKDINEYAKACSYFSDAVTKRLGDYIKRDKGKFYRYLKEIMG